MPAVMVAPVNTVVMTRGAMVTDDARAMHGQHPAAASSNDKGGSGIDGGIVVGVGIVIRIIVVIDATDKNPAEVAPVTETVAGKSRSSRDRGCRADRAAAKDSGATHAGAAATAPTTASSSSSTAVPAADFNRPLIGNGLFVCNSPANVRHAGIDRRHRLSALAGKDRHNQERGRHARHGGQEE
jgi:hypothetical protein